MEITTKLLRRDNTCTPNFVKCDYLPDSDESQLVMKLDIGDSDSDELFSNMIDLRSVWTNNIITFNYIIILLLYNYI